MIYLDLYYPSSTSNCPSYRMIASVWGKFVISQDTLDTEAGVIVIPTQIEYKTFNKEVHHAYKPFNR